MNRSLGLLSVVLMSVTLAWGPAAWAQAPAPDIKPVSPIGIDLVFLGGTISEYVEAVRSAAGGGANIVLTTTDAGSVSIPPITLDSVSVGAAVGLLEGEYKVDPHVRIQIHVDSIGPPAEGGTPVFRVSARKHGDTAPTEVKVWSVLDLIGDQSAGGKMSAKEVLTAVETAVELLVENDQPAQVRFHQSTGLLIARGTSGQLRAIDQVIGELRGSLAVLEVWQGLKEASEAQARIAELEAETEENGQDIWDLINERETLLKKHKTLEQEAKGLREELQQRDKRIRQLEERLTPETKE